MPILPPDNRVLVEMRPGAALKISETQARIRPLFEDALPGTTALGLDADAAWFEADLPDGARTPWDLAHARVADQLGVAPGDVYFAEPDIVHDVSTRVRRQGAGSICAGEARDHRLRYNPSPD